MRFEWDSAKARRNAIKHGVGFKEAATVFDDPAAWIADDVAHSRKERREWLVGESAEGRLLVVVLNRRAGPAIRIISARPATAAERISYEEIRNFPI